MNYGVGDVVWFKDDERMSWDEGYRKFEFGTISRIDEDDYDNRKTFRIEEDERRAFFYECEIDEEKTLEFSSRLTSTVKRDKYNCKRESIVERLRTKNFSVDIYKDTEEVDITIYDDEGLPHLIIDLLEKDLVKEMVYLLQKVLKED